MRLLIAVALSLAVRASAYGPNPGQGRLVKRHRRRVRNTWGIFDEYGLLKPGMGAYFDGQTATVTCNGLLPGPVGIAFSYVPPYGSRDTLEVRASGVHPQDFVVATYINVAGGWWTKPTFAQPTVAVSSDGTARIQIVSGGNDQNATEIAVYLIPSSCTPPQSGGGALPAVPCSVASARINRTPSSISGAVPDSQIERLLVR